jgi:hypothetical protein
VKNQPALIIGIIAVAVIVALAITFLSPGKYDDLAKCLTKSGAKMYGASWCPHCQDQKEMFGKSFSYVDYVECSTPDGMGQLEVCKAANITSYPTWVFPDGTRHSGPITVDQLALKAGCPAPPSG